MASVMIQGDDGKIAVHVWYSIMRQGQASTAVAMELRQHLGQGLAALRLCGPDGAVLLQQLAKELAK